MELEVSKGTAYTVATLLLVSILTLVGGTVTPVDADGDPLVLSPAYVATMRYLKATQGWLERLDQVDADLVGVMDGGGNFYHQGRNAEKAFQATLAIAREVEQTQVPPSLMAMQSAFGECAGAYVQAARSVLIYVSAPSEENQQMVTQELKEARITLSKCREMQEGMWPQQQ